MIENKEERTFPQNWQINQEFDPNKHISKFMGRDYLNVQNRLLWFIRDQRAFIASGLARMPYIVQTDLIEIDRKDKWAHFKTYVRDVLGNEATMYGSESATDFPDYAEKASTKSLGRALLLLGYGTAFAPEMDEGERVVDAPLNNQNGTGAVVRQQQSSAPAPQSRPAAVAQAAPVANRAPITPRQPAEGATTQPPTAATNADAMATDRQLTSIRKLCAALGRPEPELNTITFAGARDLLTQLSHAYSESRQAAS